MEKKRVIVVALLTVVAFLSGTLARSYAIIPATKTAPPTLHSQALSQQVPLFSIPLCSSTAAYFNLNLTGHDPGSTFISWNFFSNGPSSGIELFLYAPNSTQSTICSNNWNVALAVITTQTLSLRVLSSGNYTICCGINSGNSQASITETWTATTIS